MLVWQFLPAIEAWFSPREAADRTVTARGDLRRTRKPPSNCSKNRALRWSTSPPRSCVRDVWTRNVFSMPRGTGSGFIWDDAGHVVTNFHVIQGASEATVKLADGRDYQAALVGTSPAHDIACAQDWRRFQAPAGRAGRHQCRPQGGSEGVRYRQPLRPGLTLHTGIVSALDRSLPGEAAARPSITCPDRRRHPPWQPGGPLLDSAGRLIGINTAIYSPSGASAGIGFAVPWTPSCGSPATHQDR
jgi:S1-C subfamily serine protease